MNERNDDHQSQGVKITRHSKSSSPPRLVGVSAGRWGVPSVLSGSILL